MTSQLVGEGKATVAVAKLSLKTSQTYLLQGGRTQLNGNVLELPIPLRAEVTDHVWVLI
jgi:hypothetical protein